MQTDVHTHTKFSPDGQVEMEDLIQLALQKGVSVLGIAEHLNYDYVLHEVKIEGEEVPLINLHNYFETGRRLQEKYRGQIELLIGLEVGFVPSEKLKNSMLVVLARFRPDFIVNSVHVLDCYDLYFPEFFRGKSKEFAYSLYLDRVLESVNADYPYDIIAHLGYISRNAPYPDKMLRYEDFPEQIDKILQAIIAKGKILEVNSSANGSGDLCLPNRKILKRYYDLGGRRLSFASDTHTGNRLCDRREEVVALLKEIGFTHITIPNANETQIEL